MRDAEKDWHERFFRSSGAIDGCQKSPLEKPEMKFVAQDSKLFGLLEYHLVNFIQNDSSIVNSFAFWLATWKRQ